MNTTSIQDLSPDDFMGMGMGGGVNIGRLPDPIVIEKGKGELPNTSYEPLDIHPNPYLNGITEVPQVSPPNALPSRDIPKNTLQYAQDEATLPNYIPPPASGRRIRFVDEVSDDQIELYRRKKYRKRIFEDIWEQIQIPLLVALLYFVLSMPFFEQLFHSTLYRFLPALFTESTGSLSTYGLALKAGLFGAAYTGMMFVVQII